MMLKIGSIFQTNFCGIVDTELYAGSTMRSQCVATLRWTNRCV